MSSVLIIGGTSGIGLAAARQLAKLGSDVTVASRRLYSEEGLESIQLDISDQVSVLNYLSTHRQYSYVVLTAPMPMAFGAFKDIDIKQGRQDFEKFWNYLATVKALIETQEKLKSITLVGGAIGKRTKVGSLYPHITQQAINTLAENIALEIAPVRINVVSPGITDTNLYAEAEKADIFASALEGQPIKQVASADDVADAIVYSLAQSVMTGSVLDVDGGHHIA